MPRTERFRSFIMFLFGSLWAIPVPAEISLFSLDLDPVRTVENILAHPPSSGIVVTLVVYQSQAHRSRIKLGDVIVSYDGHRPTSISELIEFIQEANHKEKIPCQVLSKGKNRWISLQPGMVGIDGIYVEKGKRGPSRPPETSYQPDYSGLDGLEEEWFSFFMDGKKVGYERHIWNRIGEKYHLKARSLFMWNRGIQDMRIQTVFHREATLPFETLNYNWGDGQVLIEFKSMNGKMLGHISQAKTTFELPANTIPTYCSASFASTMPRTEGATRYLSLWGEGNSTIYHGIAMTCRGQEEIDVSGKLMRAWRFEQSVFGKVGNLFWLNDDRQLVKASFRQGSEIHRGTKEDVLQNLPPAVLAATDLKPSLRK